MMAYLRQASGWPGVIGVAVLMALAMLFHGMKPARIVLFWLAAALAVNVAYHETMRS